MNLKASFVTFLNEKYPQLSVEVLNNLIYEQLISPYQVTLSSKQVQSIQTEINHYWQLREWGTTHLAAEFETYGVRKPDNYSACMSYDFHINAEGQLELIEINTNASFLALGLELYSFLKLPNPVGAWNENDLISMFKNEIKLSSGKNETIAIFDDQPEQQRLYIEFLIYQALFNKHGVKSKIVSVDGTDAMQAAGLVYNRYTDFMLQEPRSALIKDLYNQKKIELSPNPYEYFMLADKKRFLDWNQQIDLPKPQSLLPLHDLANADREKIWSDRKNLFFKPRNSFGSKQAYRGASISAKTFNEVFQENFIAQKLSMPSEVEVEHEGKKLMMKYDLRCYAYKNQLQLIVARLYQGQTTNLRTAGGGFAAVKIN
ncbi:MAG: hypothetical protein H7061_02440 [Bdellovibrionaceae bacterium]|nr:hypothetical protein [Bdellovibrio sp.]